ncbi:MAG: rhamnulokinase family protein [Terrimicrobiaceae bacterium]
MLGRLEGGRVELEELHRFPSAVRRFQGSLRWDVIQIFEELKAGLREAARRGESVCGVSTDSWGVDYVLLKAGEPMLAVPYHYRDERTEGGFERVFAKVPREEVFEKTGIQFMELNTLYQLEDDARRRPEILELSDGLLLIADYINFLFSGKRAAEISLASTTQLYDPRAGGWATALAGALGIPAKLFPEVVASGTRLGPLDPALAEECRLEGVEVVATCSHDTAAAVAAVPARGDDWAYLSSGTWSLLGVELPAPVITARSLESNFTNEIGYGGTIRFLKNIIGLWIVQECRRAWEAEGVVLDYGELTRLADEASPLRSLIHPNEARFGKPGDMPGKIISYCRETGQPEPGTPGEFVRCAVESLALLYRRTLSELEEISGRTIRRIHVVGGGSRNTLLNQATADATGREVLAGPVEATALGNVLIQALALGHLSSLEELREVVRSSTMLTPYSPAPSAAWDEAHERFASLPC